MRPKAYRHHKSLPPQVRLPETQKTRTISRDGTVEDDVRREMTAEEREWWANPYRTSSPLLGDITAERQCRSQNAIDADTEMYSIIAIPPKWHVLPTSCPYDIDRR
jgi:hypothetical protein